MMRADLAARRRSKLTSDRAARTPVERQRDASRSARARRERPAQTWTATPDMNEAAAVATASGRLGLRSASSSRTSGSTLLAEVLDLFRDSAGSQPAPGRRPRPSGPRCARRSARGVPIRLVRKPSLYCTRSSKVRLRPVALALGRGLAGVLHLVAEGVDRLGVGLVDDLVRARRAPLPRCRGR